jgi:hypothetical protein
MRAASWALCCCGGCSNYESRRTLWSGDGGKWAVEVIRSDAEVKWANKSFSRAAAVARARTSADAAAISPLRRCMHNRSYWARMPHCNDALGPSLRGCTRGDWARWTSRAGPVCVGGPVPAVVQVAQDVSAAQRACRCSQRCGSKRSLLRRPANSTRGVRTCHLDHSPAAAHRRRADSTSACIDCSLLANLRLRFTSPTPAPDRISLTPRHVGATPRASARCR